MDVNVQSAYNNWAHSYDDMENKTRDLDEIATQSMLSKIITATDPVLEFGCGTGKNTEWLLKNTANLTAVDFSEEMLKKAKQKFLTGVHFQQADITQTWPFETEQFQLITCNLILEHVQNLNFVFAEAARVLKSSGYFFVSELHPVKQYQGSKARFEINNELVSPPCFIHHTSDYFTAAAGNNFTCMQLKEWFDNNNLESTPRLISFLFKKL